MGYTINQKKGYLMPANFGPWQSMATGHYTHITQMSVAYVTDKDKLAKLLPKPFEPADVPAVSYTLQVCNGCDFLAGRGYNLIAVDFTAVFKGKKDYLEGTYSAVLWETDTYPIIIGRELAGAPKLYGQIPDPTFHRGSWRFSCSEYGNKLFVGEVKNLQPVSDEMCQQISEASKNANWMLLRYLSKLGWQGSEINYATVFPSQAYVSKAWTGEGKISLNHMTFEQAPISFNIINRLKNLPVKQYQPSMMAELSLDLFASKVRKIE